MIKVFNMDNKNLKFINILKIIRPYQWVKNTLIFIPMLMSHQLSIDNFVLSLKAFVAFSLIASSIYVINDIADIESDQKHPFKKYRPLAAGLINITQCKIIIFFLLFLCALILLTTSKNFILIILSYFIISNLYTFYFKKFAFIDLLILSALYTWRIIAGGSITEISVSIWLLTFSIFFFISLAAVKRQIEFLNFRKLDEKDIAGRGYIFKDEIIINKISITSGYLAILILIFYINSSQVLNLYSYPNIMWGICIVMFFWISRIIFIAKKGKIKDDPIIFAINDKISYLCLIFILCIIWLGITI
tara:strand:- start:4025 stop:4936 length:912 start_codon:yes stop_codon:yes gene_type:complete